MSAFQRYLLHVQEKSELGERSLQRHTVGAKNRLISIYFGQFSIVFMKLSPLFHCKTSRSNANPLFYYFSNDQYYLSQCYLFLDVFTFTF